jgi:hypothetical protein
LIEEIEKKNILPRRPVLSSRDEHRIMQENKNRSLHALLARRREERHRLDRENKSADALGQQAGRKLKWKSAVGNLTAGTAETKAKSNSLDTHWARKHQIEKLGDKRNLVGAQDTQEENDRGREQKMAPELRLATGKASGINIHRRAAGSRAKQVAQKNERRTRPVSSVLPDVRYWDPVMATTRARYVSSRSTWGLQAGNEKLSKNPSGTDHLRNHSSRIWVNNQNEDRENEPGVNQWQLNEPNQKLRRKLEKNTSDLAKE